MRAISNKFTRSKYSEVKIESDTDYIGIAYTSMDILLTDIQYRQIASSRQLQTFQSKLLQVITIEPWYVTNKTLDSDLHFLTSDQPILYIYYCIYNKLS